MSTRIRLRRMGAKKRPYYRVVVADQRSPRDGRFIENIGKYHPLEDPSLIEIDEERALHWLRTGAQPSEQVQNLMSKTGIWDKFVAERPSAAAKTRANRAAAKPEVEKKSKKAKAAEAAAEVAPPEEPAAEPAKVEESAPAEEPAKAVEPAEVAEAAVETASEAPAEAPEVAEAHEVAEVAETADAPEVPAEAAAEESSEA